MHFIYRRSQIIRILQSKLDDTILHRVCWKRSKPCEFDQSSNLSSSAMKCENINKTKQKKSIFSYTWRAKATIEAYTALTKTQQHKEDALIDTKKEWQRKESKCKQRNKQTNTTKQENIFDKFHMNRHFLSRARNATQNKKNTTT